MKKKKGFTLIELLAVIVVLAIILVLAVPKILDLIEKADRQAYKESAELMAHTAQIQYQTKEVTGTAPIIPDEGIVYTFEEGVQTVSGNYDLLKFKGDKPYSGTITLTKDKKVIIEKLVSKNKKWCAIKEANEKQARVGRSTDPEFACVVEEDAPIVDKKECELEIGKVTIDDVEKEVYYIDSPSDLYALSQSVNAGNTYSGKIVKVRNDLDMSQAEGECVTSFEPIGKYGTPFSGTFDGGAKTISNLTINKSTLDNAGLFGHLKGTEESIAKVHGIRLIGAEITGRNSVGGILGHVDSYSTLSEIELDDITVSGSNAIGSVVGGKNSNGVSITISNILVKTGSVNASSNSGLLGGYFVNYFTKSIVENIKIKGSSIYTTSSSSNTFHSTNSYTSNGYDPKGVNDINFYEAVGLDTWIGGDNDNSGYYFDYNEEGKVILKSVEKNPIRFSLNQDNEGNYLIKNEEDWKEASTKTSEKYKVENNLDFNLNKYYMLGSQYNPFKGTLIGNDKEISNITINGSLGNYLGMIGLVDSATIYGLTVKGIEIVGSWDIGLFGGIKGADSTKKANIYGIRLIGGNISGSDCIGGVTGFANNYSTIREFELDGVNLSGTNSIGGIAGCKYDSGDISINNILLKTGSVTASNHAGLLGGYFENYFSNIIVENIKLTGSNKHITSSSSNTFHSTNSYSSSGFDPKGIDDVNFYDAIGLDTWIGGDNNSTGYYFDYDNDGKIVLKSVKQNPITFNLSKEGEIYLIKNEKDWKEASSKPKEKYKLENNLDFSSNKYYMLGSYYNSFTGELIGNDKTISNVTINGNKANGLGLIGFVNSATIYGLVVDNISVNGSWQVGLFGEIRGTDSTNKANVYAIRVPRGTIAGSDCVGGGVGFINNYSTIREIEFDNINISGSNSIAGVAGCMYESGDIKINNILLKNGSIKAGNCGGFLGGYFLTYFSNAIVENISLTASRPFTTSSSSNTYHSTNSYASQGFSPSLIGDLDYYADKIETLYNGDANGTGYFFDYVDDTNGIQLVKAYTPVEEETPSEKPNCTITYGEVESGCFLYKNGVHGNYLYWAATSEETGTGAACTGTGRDAAFRKRIYYNCN